MELVPNEWVLHDLAGDNGEAQRNQTFDLLERIIQQRDRFIILRGGPWMRKANKLMSNPEPSARLASKFLRTNVLLDCDLCEFLEQEQVSDLPDEYNVVPRKDVYLVQTQLSHPESVIVTTDEPLIKALVAFPKIKICHRDAFCLKYPAL